ncbi:MAG: hypothetical protein HYX53_16160 [Chloroflexi bacterium]|nr:hypothetical protein [Chloroflexota bacterium]
MTRKLLRIVYISAVIGVIVGAGIWSDTTRSAASVATSNHKNSLWRSAYVNSTYSHGNGYNEDALDLDNSGCSSSGGCYTAYFRYQGLNQYAAAYTLSNYGGGCAGRTYTVDYYVNSQWTPLIKLSFVHLKNMRSSSSGSLSYATEYDEWVGDVSENEPRTCSSGPHLHYARNLSYGTNASNGSVGGVGTWLGSDAVVYTAYGQ